MAYREKQTVEGREQHISNEHAMDHPYKHQHLGAVDAATLHEAQIITHTFWVKSIIFSPLTIAALKVLSLSLALSYCLTFFLLLLGKN